MVDKNMRNISYVLTMTVLMLLTVASTIIVDATIHSSNAIICDDLSEESETTINQNETAFVLLFGFITIVGTIDFVEDEDNSLYNFFFYDNVLKVTVIGFGTYIIDNDSNANESFFMKTFINVNYLYGSTLIKLKESDGFTRFSTFHTRLHQCVFLIDE